jgi:hypothetical protein
MIRLKEFIMQPAKHMITIMIVKHADRVEKNSSDPSKSFDPSLMGPPVEFIPFGVLPSSML